MTPKTLAPRKLLIAAIGVATINYVAAAACKPPTSGNLPAPETNVPPTAGNLPAPDPTMMADAAPPPAASAPAASTPAAKPPPAGSAPKK